MNQVLFWAETPNGGRFEEIKRMHEDDCSDAMLGETFRDWLWDDVVDYGWDTVKTVEDTNHVKFWVRTPNGGLYEETKKVHIDDSKEEMLSEMFRDWLMDEVIDYGWDIQTKKVEE